MFFKFPNKFCKNINKTPDNVDPRLSLSFWWEYYTEMLLSTWYPFIPKGIYGLVKVDVLLVNCRPVLRRLVPFSFEMLFILEYVWNITTKILYYCIDKKLLIMIFPLRLIRWSIWVQLYVDIVHYIQNVAYITFMDYDIIYTIM